MLGFLEGYTFFQQVYIVLGTVGLVLMIFTVIQIAFGLDFDSDVDIDLDSDSDISNLKLVTFQGVGGFLLMFGVVGYIFDYCGYILPPLFAILSGFLTMWIVALLFKKFKKIDSSGNVNIQSAVGKKATVYTTVNKTNGRVKVVMDNGIETYYDAITNTNKEFKFNDVVNVVQVVDNKLIVNQLNTQ